MNQEYPPKEEKIPVIEQVTPADWQKYKAIRLRGGETDPQAFGPSIIKERSASDAYWQEGLQRPDRQLFTADIDGEPASLSGLKIKDGNFFLGQVYTVPEKRGLGLSTMLVNRVIEEAKKRGAKSLFLGVNPEQTAALNFYQKLGFVQVEVEKDKLMGDGKKYDHLIMEKKLD